MMNILRNKKGFTLIEVVVFLSVIAIIVSVAIPRFINLRRMANTAKIAGDLRLIDAAINQYYLEHRVYPASVDSLSSSVLVTGKKYFSSVPKPPRGEYYISSTIGGIGKISRFPGAPDYSIIASNQSVNIVRRGALLAGGEAQVYTAEHFSDFSSLSNEYNVNWSN